VDFNELVTENLVLLSKTDEVINANGNTVKLTSGLIIAIYEYNKYDDGEEEYLLAKGVVELNNTELNGVWTAAAKWCCRIDDNGIQSVSGPAG